MIFLLKVQNNIEELSQNTVYEVLDLIEAHHIFDAQESFDRQTQEREKAHKAHVESITKGKEQEIEELRQENYSLRLKQTS